MCKTELIRVTGINLRSQALNLARPKNRKTDPRIGAPRHRFSGFFDQLLLQVIVGDLFSSTYTRNSPVFRISVQKAFYLLPHQGRHPNAYKAVQTRSRRHLGAIFPHSQQLNTPKRRLMMARKKKGIFDDLTSWLGMKTSSARVVRCFDKVLGVACRLSDDVAEFRELRLVKLGLTPYVP